MRVRFASSEAAPWRSPWPPFFVLPSDTKEGKKTHKHTGGKNNDCSKRFLILLDTCGLDCLSMPMNQHARRDYRGIASARLSARPKSNLKIKNKSSGIQHMRTFMLQKPNKNDPSISGKPAQRNTQAIRPDWTGVLLMPRPVSRNISGARPTWPAVMHTQSSVWHATCCTTGQLCTARPLVLHLRGHGSA